MRDIRGPTKQLKQTYLSATFDDGMFDAGAAMTRADGATIDHEFDGAVDSG